MPTVSRSSAQTYFILYSSPPSNQRIDPLLNDLSDGWFKYQVLHVQ